ncbi:GGDEF domain-containing protein [Hyphomonas sp.]|uniref:GGDEF domain-containing protein n=1 Tax=Hyphomonas sp. TaxID=87 RepID=UPI003918BD5C
MNVFELAEKYKTAPLPNTYAVWFAYVTGLDPKLNSELDELLLGRDQISTYDLQLLFEAYLAEEPDAFAAHEISEAIGEEINDVLATIQKSLKQSNDFSSSLDRIGSNLAQSGSPESLIEVVDTLLAENRKMAQLADDLSDGLSRSQELISNLNEQLSEVKDQSLRDPLTGIANRRAFDRALDDAIEVAEETGRPLCLAIADLDHFKQLNDTLGHQTGDHVLQAFAKLWVECTHDAELAARYGGEEFAMILPGSDHIMAYNRLVAIKNSFAGLQLLNAADGKPLPSMTVSIGLARFRSGMNPRDLVRKADELLYAAKAQGRNRVKAEGIG